MFKDGIVSFEEHMLLAGTPATVVCAGTPEKIAACEKSYTGKFLKKLL